MAILPQHGTSIYPVASQPLPGPWLQIYTHLGYTRSLNSAGILVHPNRPLINPLKITLPYLKPACMLTILISQCAP